MSEKRNDWIANLFLLAATFLWGGNWVAIKYAVQEMSPLVVVTTRTILSTIILLALLSMIGGKKPSRKDWKIFAFLGFVGIFGFNFMQFIGLKYTTAINGSLINAATPILTVILSRILIKEKLAPIQLFGVLISFLGVGWVTTKGSWDVINSLQFNGGDLMILVAATCWSIYTIYGRKPTLEYSSVAVTAYASLFATFYFTPLGIIQFQRQPVNSITWQLVLAIAYTVSVGVIALVAWLKGVSLVGPSRASIFMNLLPVFTLIFASLVLGENITTTELIGGLFVLGGVYLTTNPKNKLKHLTGVSK